MKYLQEKCKYTDEHITNDMNVFSIIVDKIEISFKHS